NALENSILTTTVRDHFFVEAQPPVLSSSIQRLKYFLERLHPHKFARFQIETPRRGSFVHRYAPPFLRPRATAPKMNDLVVEAWYSPADFTQLAKAKQT